MGEAGGGKPADFFVSYTAADRGWAEWVAWQLEEAGYRVVLQAWDFLPGQNWAHRMHEETDRAARTIVILSPAYLSSEFGAAEWLAAFARDPLGASSRLLPVRVADCERPGLLKQVVSVDLFGADEATARASLLDAAHAARSSRAKPAAPPVFPPLDADSARGAQRLDALVGAAIPAITRGDEQLAVPRLCHVTEEIGEIREVGHVVGADMVEAGGCAQGFADGLREQPVPDDRDSQTAVRHASTQW
jgi:hypothetical protein